jgi:probable HAF family extracellular repeat protein
MLFASINRCWKQYPGHRSARQRGGRNHPVRRLSVEGLEARCLLSYSIIDLGTLPGHTDSSASGINNAGQDVGQSGDHAFLYSNGVMTDLGTLTGQGPSAASAVNNAGQIVGWSTFGTTSHTFLYGNGVMTDLGVLPGWTISGASAINASGQIVGVLNNSPSPSGPSPHGFLYSDGAMVDIGTLGGDYSQADGINDAGQIVGSAALPDDTA